MLPIPPRTRWFTCAVAVFALSCRSARPPMPAMGSPQDRLDHNRSCQVVTPAVDGGRPFIVESLDYSPYRSPRTLEVRYLAEESALDALPTAQLVPVFSGLRLPLSDRPSGCERTDVEDLVDYLARGGSGHHGVDPLPTAGNVHALAAAYAPIIELLRSQELLSGGAERIRRWATAHGTTVTDLVLDARYMLAWFETAIAIRWGEFYFALYRPQTATSFTRLVVFPVTPSRPDVTFPLGNLAPVPEQRR